MLITFAIDVHLLDDATPAMDRLRHLDADSKVKLVRTDTVDTELDRATDPDKRERLFGASAEYEKVQGPAVFGDSRFDHAVYGDDDETRVLDVVFARFGGFVVCTPEHALTLVVA